MGAPGFGVVTDLDGKYVIKTQSNEVLIFSFVGYDKQEVAVSGREKIDIVMKVTSEALEEVTGVGAGVQRKASVVGAITTVDVKTMKMPTANLSNALAGNVAVISVPPGCLNMSMLLTIHNWPMRHGSPGIWNLCIPMKN